MMKSHAKTITLDAETITQAAREAGTTPEALVAMIRSVSTGRMVAVRRVKSGNGTMTFETV